MEERMNFLMEDQIPEEFLENLPESERELENISRPSVSYWQNCWIRLKKDKLAMLGIVVIVLMTIAAILVPLLSPYTYDQTDFANALQWPSAAHPFGTDKWAGISLSGPCTAHASALPSALRRPPSIW